MRGYNNESAIDSYVFIGTKSIILLYVDYCIVFFRKGSGISDRLINSLTNGKDNIEFTNEGGLKSYLAVENQT